MWHGYCQAIKLLLTLWKWYKPWGQIVNSLETELQYNTKEVSTLRFSSDLYTSYKLCDLVMRKMFNHCGGTLCLDIPWILVVKNSSYYYCLCKCVFQGHGGNWSPCLLGECPQGDHQLHWWCRGAGHRWRCPRDCHWQQGWYVLYTMSSLLLTHPLAAGMVRTLHHIFSYLQSTPQEAFIDTWRRDIYSIESDRSSTELLQKNAIICCHNVSICYCHLLVNFGFRMFYWTHCISPHHCLTYPMG